MRLIARVSRIIGSASWNLVDVPRASRIARLRNREKHRNRTIGRTEIVERAYYPTGSYAVVVEAMVRETSRRVASGRGVRSAAIKRIEKNRATQTPAAHRTEVEVTGGLV